MKVARILIAYDGSGYSHATLSELRHSGLSNKAEVLIISVSEIWMPPPLNYEEAGNFPDGDVTGYFQKHREQAKRNFAEAESIVCQAREELLRYFPDWNIKTEALAGSPASEILSRAAEFKPSLIIVGAQGLSSDWPAGLGSISQKVLSMAKCSVRISRLKAEAALSRQKIIIAFDGSPGSMAAVRIVALRPWKRKPEIRLIAVADPFTRLIPGRAFQPVHGMNEGRIEGEQKWVEMLAADALHVLSDAGLSATLHIYSGNPRMVLASEADEWSADAVFIGSNSLSSQPESYSLGCVASAIASRASCSVEVVK